MKSARIEDSGYMNINSERNQRTTECEHLPETEEETGTNRASKLAMCSAYIAAASAAQEQTVVILFKKQLAQ